MIRLLSLSHCCFLFIVSAGLISIADKLGLRLLAPRKKINILLIGNHSAGKSSFINWYIEEHVQKTGVAIETQGFTFVTSGRKRESLTGNATLHLYPHFKELAQLEGVVEYLTTEISTSKQKRFSLVTFVDTPGLVDGDMKYPFDVDKAIIWLGNLADLIFVFFDPIGQALCKRTLNLVERLNETHADRMKFYLSKADEAGHESDRQRVLMQIVQELCKRPGLNRTGFDMPTIYVPQSSSKSRCVNQIETVCVHIEKTINQTIQNTLNALEKDCENIAFLIGEKLELDRVSNSYNLRARGKGFIFFLLGLLLPAVLLVNFLASNVSKDILVSTLGEGGAETLNLYLRPVGSMWESIPRDYHLYALIGLIVFSLLLLVLAKWSTRLKPTLNRKQKRVLNEQKDFVQNHVRATKEKLYSEYLQQSVAAHDLN
ncbi:EH domain-containing protein 1-like [Patiria miniata]|uniref:Dynamin N-terminal domain-containing protein n=1 Tax=Patiria miniata TaxID=46514 RepID=A0A913ZWN6_PATMI|nr:EH domain-containing protein 1-like [Patiria miniata]